MASEMSPASLLANWLALLGDYNPASYTLIALRNSGS